LPAALPIEQQRQRFLAGPRRPLGIVFVAVGS
jgi:hypothetical protein